jgi:pentatricopeptide repeat protein
LSIFGGNKEACKICEGWQPEKVMQLFLQMQQKGMNPDKFTLVQVINTF